LIFVVVILIVSYLSGGSSRAKTGLKAQASKWLAENVGGKWLEATGGLGLAPAKAGAFGKWLAIPWLLSQCRKYNPDLTWAQQIQLGETISRIFDAWQNGQAWTSLLQGAIALAVPNAYLALEIVQSFTSIASLPSSAPSSSSNKNIGNTSANDTLMRKYGCDVSKSCPDGRIQSLILAELDKAPLCAITLDPILNYSKKIVSGVAALCQRDQSGQEPSHVFLYRREALEQWLNSSRVNPLTRLPIDTNRDVFLIS